MDDDAEEVRRLEESLWRTETRFDRSHLQRVLAPDFAEFGRSGRTYAYEDTVSAPWQPIDVVLPLPGFTAHRIAPDVLLLTYRTEGSATLPANRCSVWVRASDGWRLRFHQATPTT